MGGKNLVEAHVPFNRVAEGPADRDPAATSDRGDGDVLSEESVVADRPAEIGEERGLVEWGLTAFWEEVLFRGIVLTSAVEGLRSRWISDRGAVIAGVVASSLIFTAFHFPGSVGAFGFRMTLGLLLGAAYVWTDSLALPIGLHFMTNFALNNIYGLSNVAEGGARAAMLLRPAFTGPSEFVQLYGTVNAGAVLCVVALTVGYIMIRNGELSPRLSSKYFEEGSSG